MMKKQVCVLLAAALLSGCTARTLPTTREQSAVPTASAGEEATDSEATAGDEAINDEAADSEATAGDEAINDDAVNDEVVGSEATGSEAAADESADWALLLANSTHEIGDYEPTLAEVQGVYRMDVRVAESAKKMIADAQAQGVSLLVCSAYRPFSSQKRNFDASVARNIAAGMTKEQALSATKALIAEPGKSEHQTGLAADIVTPLYQGLDDGYAETAAAKWLLKNAADYGFILRYPQDKTAITGIDFEPWHYRYVGVAAAKSIMEQGLCLEEFLEAGAL